MYVPFFVTEDPQVETLYKEVELFVCYSNIA